MIVLSHRGYWLKDAERNSKAAFERSFSLGFGTETDVRDFNGELVISHDIPDETTGHIGIEEFFKIYKSFDGDLPLALNIKADGLQVKLAEKIAQYDITNYFVFDMSVPDGLQYFKHALNVFTRQSEYEINPSFYKAAKGVWLDEFEGHWINEKVILNHVQNSKDICIVSPELHKRSYLAEWSNYRDILRIADYRNIMICTDKPEEAQLYFNGN